MTKGRKNQKQAGSKLKTFTVPLASVENKESVDIDSGKMSSVTSDETVLPITAFSGEMMRDFEFAGERMNSNEASGEKIDLN